MSQSPKLVTIFGGSGFVGRYIARRMAKEGWRVRVAVRRPNEAIFVRPYGVVGQVEPVLANIRDDASVRKAIAGADAVVNCVGILQQSGPQKFDAVQAEGAGRVARIAKEEGVGQLVHISAIGADAASKSGYARTKAEGEALVLAAFPKAVILRPSIMFGDEDNFFNRFATMARLSPVIPLVGADTRFQPVYVDDVAQAAVKGVLGQAKAGIYELGGPDVETFDQLVTRMLKVIRRSRFKLPMPFWVASIEAKGLDLAQKLTGGLFTNTILTADQVELLKTDNVVSEGAKGFADLGITPTPMSSVLDKYLYRHRPYGQYTELTESSRDLKA
jgi:NADH dehydrogenase